MHAGIYASMMVSAAENLPMGILQARLQKRHRLMVITGNLCAGHLHPSHDEAPAQLAGHMVDDLTVDVMVVVGDGPGQGSAH